MKRKKTKQLNVSWISPTKPDCYCYKHNKEYFSFGKCPKCEKDKKVSNN